MAGGIAAGALGSSGLLGAAAALTVERPRSGGKPEGQLNFVHHYGPDVPVWLVSADSGLVAMRKFLRATDYHPLPSPHRSVYLE